MAWCGVMCGVFLVGILVIEKKEAGVSLVRHGVVYRCMRFVSAVVPVLRLCCDLGGVGWE